MNVTFIGGGNMASAMIGGLLAQGWSANAISVIEVAAAARERLGRDFKVTTHPALTAAAAQADCIVLAVKPQQLREVAAGLRAQLKSQLVVTIAAGIRLEDLARWLGGYARLVRVMPNTPALVRAGVSALCAASGVSAQERAAAEQLLAAVGATVWLDHEEQIDAVTAVSGSGPAYVFFFMEALEQAARELGLPDATARKLALETFAGAARLALASADPPATLRERVTSKGGTTEAALKSLAGERVKEAIVRAVRAAAARSHELGDELGKDR
jgi:pyrroline-5-carboxylate reductase